MGGLEGFNELPEVLVSFGKKQEIVRRNTREDGARNGNHNQERPEHEGNEHHGEGAALRNAAPFGVRLSKASGKLVVNLNLLVVTKIGFNKAGWRTGIKHDEFEQLPGDLVEALI